jgi:iron complex transport system substrate-binding protein
MAAFASLWVASAAALRVASLNMCSDEYALLLARPGEVVSVTRLSHDPQESVLASRTRTIASNRGRLEDVLGARPTLVLTMGGGGRSSGRIARSMGMRVVDLSAPTSLDGVAATLSTVGAALGDRHRADPLLARLAALRRSAPAATLDAIWLGGGGLSLSADGLGAQWLALAGLRQRSLPGGRASLETLVTSPPKLLVESNYRAAQMSLGQRWLAHPLLSRLPSRRVATDGRRWTCAGPLLIDEIERLRRVAR